MSESGKYCCFNCPAKDYERKELADLCPTCGQEYGFPLTFKPKAIGNFDVESALARGFYGAAYVGRRRGPISLRRVLKVAPRAMYEFFEKSIEDEVRQHVEAADGAEFIVGVENMFDADIDFDGRIIPCHVVELQYLDGDPLEKYLSGRRHLGAGQAAQIACDLFQMREEFELRLKHHNDLHAGNIIIQELPKASWRRGDPIEPAIRAMAIDLGSVAADRRSNDDEVGDIHWIGTHLRRMAERLLVDSEEAGDLEKRVALKLLGISQTLSAITENQRPPSAEDMVRQIRSEYHQVAEPWRPWRVDLVLPRFEESYNAQTLDAWYVPQLLVDPEDTWVDRVSASGPLVMTGMRGCGKTMLLHSVEFHARAALRSGEAEADAVARVAQDRYVGLFVSAQRLIPMRGEARPKADQLFARLVVAYAAAAARALAHLADLDAASVEADAAASIARAVGEVLIPDPGLPEPATIEQLERSLVDLLIRLSRSDSPFELATTPATAFPHLAGAVRRAARIWRDAQVLFLLDDVSTRYLDTGRIEELLSALIFQHPDCAFKLTSEAQTIFLSLKSPGELHPALAGRDFQAFDLGAEVYDRLKRPGGGRDFVNEILRARSRFNPGHPQLEPKNVLGDVDLVTIARDVVASQPTSKERKRLYRGLSALAGVCVGDIGSVIQIYQAIIARGHHNYPVPAQDQNAAFQDFCARYLYHLDRRDSDLKAVAMGFAEAAYHLMMQSGKDPTSKRLRQYTSIYVRITSGDVEEQSKRLRDFVDAGVFVFAGAAPRTKTRDSNPIQQFQLSYRKLYGLVNSIGLSERDRFELSGKNLQEWLAEPAKTKEILLRNLAVPGPWDEEGDDADIGPEQPREFIRTPVQLVLPEPLPEPAAVATPTRGAALPMPAVQRFRLDEVEKTGGTLVVGLGFEDRTPESFERLLASIRPDRIVAIRYSDVGHSARMVESASAAGVGLEEVSYSDLQNGATVSLDGETLIDITGLAKPALFSLTRSAMAGGRSLSIAYTAALQYAPAEAELQAVLDAYASYNRHETLTALRSVLTGERGPYQPIPLLAAESDGSRNRGLCAFASAKHERILHLIENREYDAVELMVDAADTARAKVAEMAGRVALEECRGGALVAENVSDLETALHVLARTHQRWYVEWGFNFELGLTGNKVQATAAAVVSSILPVNEVWYVAPSTFDPARFTQGTGETTIYRLDRRDVLA